MDATWVAQVTAALAGGMLLAAASAKLVERAHGNDLLRALGLPARLAEALPFVELAAAGCLLGGIAPLAAASAATALALTFVTVLLVAQVRGVSAPCRCFGALDSATPAGVSLARALFIVAVTATLTAAVAAGGHPRVTPAGPASWLGALLALCTVLAFALAGQALSFHRALRRLTHVSDGGGPHGVPSP